MNARRAILGAADIDCRGIEMDLLPANVDQFANSQRMPESHQDQQPIANRVAAVARGRNQLVDLGFRQVLALPVISVLGTATANVGFSDCEGLNWMTVFIGKFPLCEYELST